LRGQLKESLYEECDADVILERAETHLLAWPGLLKTHSVCHWNRASNGQSLAGTFPSRFLLYGSGQRGGNTNTLVNELDGSNIASTFDTSLMTSMTCRPILI
jgi:hypothetical protein